MKKIKVQTNTEVKPISVPSCRFLGSYISDFFVCSNCDFSGYFKVLGNTKTCPKCGGTMYRK